MAWPAQSGRSVLPQADGVRALSQTCMVVAASALACGLGVRAEVTHTVI